MSSIMRDGPRYQTCLACLRRYLGVWPNQGRVNMHHNAFIASAGDVFSCRGTKFEKMLSASCRM
jgi:hypothetical protein